MQLPLHTATPALKPPWPCLFKPWTRALSAAPANLICRQRLELAAAREEERRAELTERLSAKQQRVAAMEAERAEAARALQAVHKEIAAQEARLR